MTQAPEVRRPQNTSAPTTAASARKDVKSLLEGPLFRAEIAKVLPRHLTPERMIRVAITATMKTPKLLQCTADSLTRCMLDCSALGLEPDGRRAHLIPFEDKKNGVVICTLIIDYKGLAELAMRSGLVSNIHADVVRENDVFEYDLGEIKTHKIDFRGDRGAAYAFYAICRFKDGSLKADVMSVDEVEAIRFRSKSPNAGPWVTDPVEMGKKTVFRRLAKWLPLSPEFRDAIEKDDESEDPIGKALNVTPAVPEIAAPQFRKPDAIQQREPEAREEQAEPDPVEATETADRHADPGTDNTVRSVRMAKPAAPTTAPASAPATDSAQAQLETIITGAGLTLDDYNRWAIDQQETPMEFPTFGDVPPLIAARHVKAKTGLIRMVGALKGGAQ